MSKLLPRSQIDHTSGKDTLQMDKFNNCIPNNSCFLKDGLILCPLMQVFFQYFVLVYGSPYGFMGNNDPSGAKTVRK